jgi:hypothetical protein
LENVLQGKKCGAFLDNMYGNEPNRWSSKLEGWDRLRMIANYFTRMRLCQADGTLHLGTKFTINAPASDYAPWFQQPSQLPRKLNIIWASGTAFSHLDWVNALFSKFSLGKSNRCADQLTLDFPTTFVFAFPSKCAGLCCVLFCRPLGGTERQDPHETDPCAGHRLCLGKPSHFDETNKPPTL